MFTLDVDLGPVLGLASGFRAAVDGAMSNAARDLALQTHTHILEEVQQKLHSSRQQYVDALSFKQDGDVWIISLDKKAFWIDDGIKPGTDMLDGLLASPHAKIAKDGSKYTSVPFKLNKGPTQQTPAQNDLTKTLKSEMKARKIPYGKIEVGPDGAPKLGMIHSFDILSKPIKKVEGVGQGHGPIGQVRQGMTGIPFLRNVRVYQQEVTDKKGKTSTQKSIMTFRVASSKQRGRGMWRHPGTIPHRFMEDAVEWALQEWRDKISNQVLVDITKNF